MAEKKDFRKQRSLVQIDLAMQALLNRYTRAIAIMLTGGQDKGHQYKFYVGRLEECKDRVFRELEIECSGQKENSPPEAPRFSAESKQKNTGAGRHSIDALESISPAKKF